MVAMGPAAEWVPGRMRNPYLPCFFSLSPLEVRATGNFCFRHHFTEDQLRKNQEASPGGNESGCNRNGAVLMEEGAGLSCGGSLMIGGGSILMEEGLY